MSAENVWSDACPTSVAADSTQPKPIMRQSDYQNAIADLVKTASYYGYLWRTRDEGRKKVAEKRELANRLNREAAALADDIERAPEKRQRALDQIAKHRQGAAIFKALAALEGADAATLAEVVKVLEGGK